MRDRTRFRVQDRRATRGDSRALSNPLRLTYPLCVAPSYLDMYENMHMKTDSADEQQRPHGRPDQRHFGAPLLTPASERAGSGRDDG